MPVNKEKLYKLYMEWVDRVSEDLDWKTHFGPKEIVNAIADIIDEHDDLIMTPIHKFNNANGATLCHNCRTIIAVGLTDDIFCKECKAERGEL